MFPTSRDLISVGFFTSKYPSQLLTDVRRNKAKKKRFSRSSHIGGFHLVFFIFRHFESPPKSNFCEPKCFQAPPETSGAGECSAPLRVCSFDDLMNGNLWFFNICIWPAHPEIEGWSCSCVNHLIQAYVKQVWSYNLQPIETGSPSVEVGISTKEGKKKQLRLNKPFTQSQPCNLCVCFIFPQM